MRTTHVMGLTAMAMTAVVVAVLAAPPAHVSTKAAPKAAGVRGDVPELAGDADGIERMDGPDAWEALGMGPAGLAVPYGRGRAAAGLRMRAAAERRLELAKQLDLSEGQRDRVEAIRDRARREAITRQAKLELARLDLRAMLRSEAPNRARIGAKADELSRLEAQSRKARLDALLDMRDVLTAEQRKKLKALRAGAQGGD